MNTPASGANQSAIRVPMNTHRGAGTRTSRTVGIILLIWGGTILLMSFCAGPFGVWVIDSPAWPGLDRPPAYEVKQAAMQSRMMGMTLLWFTVCCCMSVS